MLWSSDATKQHAVTEIMKVVAGRRRSPASALTLSSVSDSFLPHPRHLTFSSLIHASLVELDLALPFWLKPDGGHTLSFYPPPSPVASIRTRCHSLLSLSSSSCLCHKYDMHDHHHYHHIISRMGRVTVSDQTCFFAIVIMRK